MDYPQQTNRKDREMKLVKDVQAYLKEAGISEHDLPTAKEIKMINALCNSALRNKLRWKTNGRLPNFKVRIGKMGLFEFHYDDTITRTFTAKNRTGLIASALIHIKSLRF